MVETPLETQADEETLSRKAGLSSDVENRYLRGTCALIQDTGIKIGFPQWAICSAMHLFHLYFARRSVLKNDRFLVAVACLFLAGKINESCRPPKEIIVAAWVLKCKKDRQKRQLLNDPWFLDMMCDHLIQTERVVLSIVGFEFRWTAPQKHMLSLVTHCQVADTKESRDAVAQIALNLLNECMRSKMCIQFSSRSLAAAAVTFACYVRDVEVDHEKLWERAQIEDSPEIITAIFALYEASFNDSSIPQDPAPWLEDFNKNDNHQEGIQDLYSPT